MWGCIQTTRPGFIKIKEYSPSSRLRSIPGLESSSVFPGSKLNKSSSGAMPPGRCIFCCGRYVFVQIIIGVMNYNLALLSSTWSRYTVKTAITVTSYSRSTAITVTSYSRSSAITATSYNRSPAITVTSYSQSPAITVTSYSRSPAITVTSYSRSPAIKVTPYSRPPAIKVTPYRRSPAIKSPLTADHLP